MKRTHLRRRLFALTSLLFLTFLLILPVSADMGPKPRIDITVENPPTGDYYLDLCAVPRAGGELYSDLSDEELAALPPAAYDALLAYNDEGFRAMLTAGTTGAPLFGRLTGERQPDGTARHTFSYHGTPTEYRILVVLPDGTAKAGETVHRDTFRQTVTFDYATGHVKVETSVVGGYLTQFATTLLGTLLLEGVILLLFGYALRKHWKPFLLVNLVTQIGMTAFTGTALIFSGEMSAHAAFILAEIVIFIAEAVAYAFLLRDHSRARAVAYAIVANLVSAGFGWLLIGWLFRIIYG